MKIAYIVEVHSERSDKWITSQAWTGSPDMPQLADESFASRVAAENRANQIARDSKAQVRVVPVAST